MKSKRFVLPAVAAFTLAGSPLVFAGDREPDEAKLAARAHVDAVQAIEAARRAHPGRAFAADLEDKNGRLLYVVEIAQGDKTLEVSVDAHSGKVIGASADAPDHGGDAD